MGEEDKDALDALESEAKEWEKDAEIERILNAFRLDACVPVSPRDLNYPTPRPFLANKAHSPAAATQS